MISALAILHSAYLTKVPVKEIKIDQAFVIGMRTVKKDAIIVNAIIQLAHNLGLTVTAEGVESGESFERLRSLGCDAMQGMYISMPMKAKELVPGCKTGRRRCGDRGRPRLSDSSSLTP